MRKFLCLILFVAGICAFAGEKKEYTAEQFLSIVRRPPGRQSWAALNGYAMHRRRGQATVEAPFYLGIMFTPFRTLAQIVIDRKEGYFVGQKYQGADDATSIKPMPGNPKVPILANFGIKPQDLTMTFLFWKLIKELPRDSAGGAECRVFLLESPDGKEVVKAFLSAEYFFPLKVEWFKDKKNLKKPYRNVEISSYKKVNNMYVVSRLQLWGPGWRSKVVFEKIKAGDTKKTPAPKNLFQEKLVTASPKK